MNAIKMVAVALLIAGTLALAYGSFSYTKDTHKTELGPVEITVKDKETINIPGWAGFGAILVGVLLLATAGEKKV